MIALAVLVAATAFFVFVYDRIEWGRHVRIRVYFHHAGALHEGGAFVAAGRSVGKIEAIALVPRGGSKLLGDDEGVVVKVAIDADIATQLDRGGDVFVASRGALAERYLELGPGTTGESLHEGDELRGADPPSLDRVLQRTWDNLQTMAAFRDQVRPEWDALRAQLTELRAHLDPASATAIAHADKIAPMWLETSGLLDEIQTLRERGHTADVRDTIARVSAFYATARTQIVGLSQQAAQLGAAVDRLRTKLGPKGDAAIAAVEKAIDQVRADIAKIDPLLAQIDALNRALARGDGSIMKILHDPEFPEDAKDLGKLMKREPWKVIDRPADDHRLSP
ncbi:MAG: MlaD family protein [Kofleriaceae bacterium]